MRKFMKRRSGGYRLPIPTDELIRLIEERADKVDTYADLPEGTQMVRPPIILTEEIVPPPALIRASLDARPSIVRAEGERASRRVIEPFTASIRNRNTRMASLAFHHGPG